MKLDSSNSPVLLPQRDQTTVLRLGFENCNVENWLFAPYDLPLFHQHKTALIADEHAHCHAEIAGSESVQSEFHDFLLARLELDPDHGYRLRGKQLLNERANLEWDIDEKTLWTASTWIAEDICLLEEVDGRHMLTAASVCSPSNWHLEDKIGQSIDFIHAPVPGYEDQLSERVNRFLHGLRNNRVMLRYNWSIQSGNELYWRDGSTHADKAENPTQVPHYWRIERQTFLRLPQSGAIVFGIRIFLHSFASLRQIDGFDQSIAALVTQLPAAERQYKGIDIL